MTQPPVSELLCLPPLVTRRALRDAGIARVDLDRIWARSEQVMVPGSRVVYVRREDIDRHLVVVPVNGVRPRQAA